MWLRPEGRGASEKVSRREPLAAALDEQSRNLRDGLIGQAAALG